MGNRKSDFSKKASTRPFKAVFDFVLKKSNLWRNNKFSSDKKIIGKSKVDGGTKKNIGKIWENIFEQIFFILFWFFFFVRNFWRFFLSLLFPGVGKAGTI